MYPSWQKGVHIENNIPVVFIWLHCCCSEWEGWYSLTRYNHTSWVTVVTPTDRPKSVRNRCVIKGFGGVFVLSICFRIFCWYRGFVIGLSQISFFFSLGSKTSVIRHRMIYLLLVQYTHSDKELSSVSSRSLSFASEFNRALPTRADSIGACNK